MNSNSKLIFIVFLSILVIGCETSTNPKSPPEKTDCADESNGLNCNEISDCEENVLDGQNCNLADCQDGSDEKSCAGPEPLLFVSTNRDIRYISLRSNKFGVIGSNSFVVHGVEFNNDENFVYWSEKKRDKAGIYKAMLNGTAYQHVISAGVEAVEDLAIDWVADNIYFTDSGRKHIAVCKLDGSVCSVVISRQLHKPRAVAVCPEERLLFWSDWGSHPHIGSAGMDGSEDDYLISSDIAWPNGLTVDETAGRIFWIDAKLKRIESCDFDGSDRKILPVQSTHPYALDIFENTVYWCDYKENEVISVNKFNGTNRKVLMNMTSLSQPAGIHVYHPSKQRLIFNPCNQVNCSHLCLLSTNADGYCCACPIGMTLNQNNLTCDPSSNHPLSVVTATSTNISVWTFRQIGKNSIVHLPTRGLGYIGALAFDPYSNSIIYSDLKSRMIYSMHLETRRQRVLFKNAKMVEGLDVDPYTGSFYWTEVNRGIVALGYKVYKARNSHIFERLILVRGLHKPKAITLASKYGLMFIVEESHNYIISVIHMDGKAKRELLAIHGAVSAMAFDGEHLYFSDSLRGSIERIQIDGRNRRILRSYVGAVTAIDTSSKSIFWLTQHSTRINWLKKDKVELKPYIAKDVSDNITHQYRLMAVIEHGVSDKHNVCVDYLKFNYCLGICVPTPNGAKCLCPRGGC